MTNVNKVSTLSERLSQLLEKEFTALQAKSFDEVEELQNSKFYLMQDLQLAWDLMRKEISDADAPVMDEVTGKIEVCNNDLEFSQPFLSLLDALFCFFSLPSKFYSAFLSPLLLASFRFLSSPKATSN